MTLNFPLRYYVLISEKLMPDHDYVRKRTCTKRKTLQVQKLLQRGREDRTTTVTVSVIFYFTEAFAKVTPDMNGHVKNVIANANIAFLKSGIPVKLSTKCMLKADMGEAPDSANRIREFKNIQGEI